MLVSAGAIYGLATTAAFGFERLDVSGATLTDEAAIRTAVALEDGTNLVGLATDPVEARLGQLPSIRSVDVSVGLPDALRVTIEERRPLIVWAIGDRRFAVDGGGLLFAEATSDASPVSQSVPISPSIVMRSKGTAPQINVAAQGGSVAATGASSYAAVVRG